MTFRSYYVQKRMLKYLISLNALFETTYKKVHILIPQPHCEL